MNMLTCTSPNSDFDGVIGKPKKSIIKFVRNNEKPKSCLNCKHCYNKEVCTLLDDLIELYGSCKMWSKR